MIAEKIGLLPMIDQTGEEANELAQACYKMARVLRAKNPTPWTEERARQAIVEEIADVYVCTAELTRALHIIPAEVDRVVEQKIERARERLEGFESTMP